MRRPYGVRFRSDALWVALESTANAKLATLPDYTRLERHKTSYKQLIASVTPETRASYCALVGRG